MLEVRFIGRFDIQCDGKPVVLSSRAAQSLFAYMILTAGTLHRREKLAGMLWPDESEQKARTYLRNELWRIRKALPQTSNVEYLVTDNLTVGFNPSSTYWLDVAVFKNISDSTSADELITGLSHYESELLPGFYEDWVVLEREHLQVHFEHKIACLLEMLEKENRWDDILDWAERWISLAQAPETAYRALMLAYDALGDHAKVASTYERCKQALRQLDLEPSEQTRALAFKRSSKIRVPIPLSSFVGREKELKEVALLFSKFRLITLTGSGGVGKTRLAIQVVAEVLDLFPDGVWFLDLAPLTDPALVPNTLASLIVLHESGEIAVNELLINYFRSRTALIIFDNCEHLIDSCAQLINLLLTSCENLAILATSRETLRVSGELPYRVPSLEIPKPNIEFNISEFSSIEAIRLFIDRVAVTSPSFALSEQNAILIAQICQRLDGIPLALELAAAWVSILTVQQIWKYLDDRFRLLTSGVRTVLPRQQTLRALIDWSYDLLSENECLLLRRLSVFAGGWTLEAAAEVCVGQDDILPYAVLDVLTQLVNKSLVDVVEHSQSGEVRYRMLETIRQYARDKLLEAGGGEIIRDKHLAYFVKLAEQAEPELYRSNQVFWFNKLDDELDNLRIALEWALATDLKSGLRIAAVPWRFWDGRSYFQEAGGWLSLLLEHYQTIDSLHSQALAAHSIYIWRQGNFPETVRMAEQSLQMARTLSDKQAEAFSLSFLGVFTVLQGSVGSGVPLLEQSLAIYRALGDKIGQATTTDWLSMNGSDLEHQITFASESLKLHQELGNLAGIAYSLSSLAQFTIWKGDFSSPVSWLEEALSISRQLGDSYRESEGLHTLGDLAYWQGDYQRAIAYYEEVITLSEIIGNKFGSLWAHVFMAYAVSRLGDIQKARKMFEDSVQNTHKAGFTIALVFTIEGIASMCVSQNQPERAARLFAWADAIREKIGDHRPPVEQASVERDLADIQSQLDNAEFAKLSEEGRAMTTEQAVAYALEEQH